MIYAIRFGFFGLKFGVADNPAARLADLQTAAPVDLELVAAADWPDEFERFIHEYLRETRLRGEWFQHSPKADQVIQIMQGAGDKGTQGRFLALLIPHLQGALAKEATNRDERRTLRRRAERVAWWMGEEDPQTLRAGCVWDGAARRWVKAQSRHARISELLNRAMGTSDAY